MIEEKAQAEAVYQEVVKDSYRVYVVPYQTYCTAYAYYLTNLPIVAQSMGKPDKSELDIFLDKVRSCYTEEEIVSPCKSLKEFEKREQFLKFGYMRQVPCRSKYNQGFSDPICDYLVVEPEYKEFINRHIRLWADLQKLRRPSVFPHLNNGLSMLEKAIRYWAFIPYADPDDFMLPDIEDYFRAYARDIVKLAYEAGRQDMVIDLINKGYVKKPTLQKLLEIANEKNDNVLVAVLLDKMKDQQTKNKSAKFAL